MPTPCHCQWIPPVTLGLAACLGVTCANRSNEPAAGGVAATATLVLFLDDDASFATADLRRNHLGPLRDLADELGIALEVRSVQDGAPAQVRITPLILFENHLGRSIYQGRYANIDRVRHFVRTARMIPQSDTPQTRTSIPVWRTGRATVVTPLKITALGGEVPDGFDQTGFVRESRQAIAAGMDRFEARKEVSLGRSDRLFYLDFHPHLAAGVLFLSLEMYSQFNCHDPIYSGVDDPIIGPWEDRAEIFAEAAGLLEQELLRQMASSGRGDAFAPVPSGVPLADWNALGLGLPAAPPDAGRRRGPSPDIDVPRDWTIALAATNGPAVHLRFPPPIDNMTGEVPTLDARLTLGPNVTGLFRVDVADLTMGDGLLDAVIQGAEMLDTASYPIATFRLDSIEGDLDTLRFGELTLATMLGTFHMIGRNIPLSVRTTFEPVIDAQGRPRLLVTADWTLRLREPFGLNGPPDSPYPANDTLLFRCHITLRPSESDPGKENNP